MIFLFCSRRTVVLRSMKRKGEALEHPHKKLSKGQADRGGNPAGGAVIRHGYNAVSRTSGAAVIGEMKYFDCELANTAIAAVTTTWVAGTMKDPSTTINLGSAAVATPLCLFAPTVGAALNQRIGRKVKVLKIKCNCQITVGSQAAQTTADNAGTIRVFLVQDCQSNASQMTGAQLMNDAGQPETTILSYQNPNNFGRFRVLKEKRFVLEDPNMAGEVAAGNVIQMGLKKLFKMNVNFKQPVLVNFNATNGGTVADIVDHSFHIVIGADLVNLAPVLGYYTRVCYKE